MLTNKELTDALIVNLKSWDWDINSKFGIDQKTGDALIDTYNRMKAEINELNDVIQEMLD